MVHAASSSPPKMKGVAGLSPFLHVWCLWGCGKTVIRQEMGYGGTVSSGRYMKQARRFMLKTVADRAFWADFVGAETLFFLGKNCFWGLLLVVFVRVFAYVACAVVSAFYFDC